MIPNGVDSQLLMPLPKDECKGRLGLKGNVLGYVGSLEHWVDLETVVEAMPFLDAKLMVVGPGLFTDYGEKIKSLAERCGVADKMKFVGAVRYSELGRYISVMDIGLNPLKNMLKNQRPWGERSSTTSPAGLAPLIFLLHSTIPVNISIRTENTAISGEL